MNARGARSLIIVGAGGHSKVVIETGRLLGFNVLGLLDTARVGEAVLGVPVIGSDADAPRLRAEGLREVFIALGDNARRLSASRRFKELGFGFPELVHPNAVLSPTASVGPGTLVMVCAVLNAEVSVGSHVIINTGAIVEHDCRVDDGAHIAPGVRLGGGCRIGRGALVGLGASVRPLSRIGENAIVGVGAVVVRDVAANAIVVGVPARVRSSVHQSHP